MTIWPSLLPNERMNLAGEIAAMVPGIQPVGYLDYFSSKEPRWITPDGNIVDAAGNIISGPGGGPINLTVTAPGAGAGGGQNVATTDTSSSTDPFTSDGASIDAWASSPYDFTGQGGVQSAVDKALGPANSTSSSKGAIILLALGVLVAFLVLRKEL